VSDQVISLPFYPYLGIVTGMVTNAFLTLLMNELLQFSKLRLREVLYFCCGRWDIS